MGALDMTEKTLESYNDVFADIVNVLLFDGRRVVREDDLQAESPRSIYKADAKLHEQERDVAKYWRNGTIRIAMFGFENQTAVDNDMPLRIIGYDGAAYRAQLLNKGRQRYPVVSLVLYFGETHWNKPLTLIERLEIPEDLRPFVSDYRINLREISFLSEETVQKFQSDFRIVADYFVQKRKNKDYAASKKQIEHVNEFLKLMSVITGDHRFEEIYSPKLEGGATMCEILDRVENRGIQRGLERGLVQGRMQGIEQGRMQGVKRGYEDATVAMLQKLIKNTQMSAAQAMTVLEIPDASRDKYLNLLEKN